MEQLKEDRAEGEERRAESKTLSFTLLRKPTVGRRHWTQPGNRELSGSQPPSLIQPLRKILLSVEVQRVKGTSAPDCAKFKVRRLV